MRQVNYYLNIQQYSEYHKLFAALAGYELTLEKTASF